MTSSSSITGPVIALLYGICSASMTFINKAILTSYSYNYPCFLVTCQMIFSIILLEILRLTRQASLERFSISRGVQFLIPSVFYAVHCVLALSALSGMNIPMYGLIKRCCPVVILIFTTIILKKGMPNAMVTSSVACITVGCIIAGLGDLSFDLKAYMFGIFSVLSQALYLVLVQKHGQDLGALETLHINSYNTLPLLLISSLALGELNHAVYDLGSRDIVFFITFLAVIAFGCLLNYLLFLCTTYNSALTTSITGSLKSIIQTVIGMFTFGGISINIFTIIGILMNLGGGVAYSLAKYRDARIKELMDKTNKNMRDGMNIEVKVSSEKLLQMNGNIDYTEVKESIKK